MRVIPLSGTNRRLTIKVRGREVFLSIDKPPLIAALEVSWMASSVEAALEFEATATAATLKPHLQRFAPFADLVKGMEEALSNGNTQTSTDVNRQSNGSQGNRVTSRRGRVDYKR